MSALGPLPLPSSYSAERSTTMITMSTTMRSRVAARNHRLSTTRRRRKRR